MQYVEFDESRKQIVVIKFKNIEPTEEQFDEYLDAILKLHDKYNNFVLIMDASKTKSISSKLRIKQGNWMNKHKDLIKQNCLCLIFVVPNLIIKIMLEGIFMVSKPPTKYSIAPKFETALEWAKALI